ncbi:MULTISPECIES: MucR family transcriptional regulator [Geobacter]|uniref:MucR family transcriptional regulator n=2 Tax=Geobacter TaxID=28231 RepID=A0A0C1QVA1_9BACT|nr:MULTISPECIES: MucR family transcriptional regulator [Geobacter]KIE42091.1 MucR family transcriptional regulator [Geobacter soli]MBE2886652.1 MucR family transcriptional regulator [Geobacter anodireducens]HMN03106.1 MucR family transcriptional regulator [Geobacter anodireducens]
MAPTLLELTASIVSSHAAVSELSTEELVQEIQKVHATLQQLEGGAAAPEAAAEEAKAPAMTLKKAFQADQVCCMICGKGGMKTLTRHLAQVHQMKPGEYRKQFNIPSSQPLTAKKFSEARKQMAKDRGLAENLAKARAVRAAKIQEKKAAAAEKPAKAKATRAKKATA